MTDQASASYDETPYTSFPQLRTHPDRLATMATLLGLSPPSPARCRVLELGCGDGGNLLPMAAQFPDAEFVGIDASAVQIDDGCRVARAVGLNNTSLAQGDILAIGPDWGEFDYIITHGVYSWVPPVVQDKILEISSKNLSSNGVAYVSYNTNPGWRLRGIARDLMSFGSRNVRDHRERIKQARGALEALTRVMPPNSLHGRILQLEHEHLSKKEDYYLLHEYLEDENAPIYFHEFAERAARHGLQFLTEANSLDGDDRTVPSEVAELIARMASNIVEAEQYADFVSGKMFRQTLLCHASHTVVRPPDPARIRELYVVSPIRATTPDPDLASDEPVTFEHPHSSLTTSTPLLKSALQCLAKRWPQGVSFTELLAEARERLGRSANGSAVDPNEDGEFAEAMLRCFVTRQIDLRTESPAVAATPGRRPLAPSLTRYQAANGRHVTNLRHQIVQVDDMQRYLLPHLDGTHDRTWLLDRLLGEVVSGNLDLCEKDRPVTDAAAARRLLAKMLDGSIEDLTMAALFQPNGGGEFRAGAASATGEAARSNH